MECTWMVDGKPGLILKKMAEISRRIGKIVKKERGQNYNFRGRDTVVNAMQPVIEEAGVVVSRVSTEYVHREINSTKAGGANYFTLLLCKWYLIATDGSYVVVEAAGEGADLSDKATGKAHSYALRQMLLDTFLVRTNDVEPDSQRPGLDDEEDPVKALRTLKVQLIARVTKYRGRQEMPSAKWIAHITKLVLDTDRLESIEEVEVVSEAIFDGQFDKVTGNRITSE